MSDNPVALIVDDEPQMVSIIEFALQTQGFTCLSANCGQKAWQLITSHKVDLVVLDLMLPDISGLTLCARIRSHSDVAIIMLTALGEESDRVRGLETGADDYVIKPFSPRELALRAQAIVRRTSSTNAQTESNTINRGDLHISSTGEIYWQQRLVGLTGTEHKLFVALAKKLGQVVSRRELLNTVWDTIGQAGGADMIKTTIYRLRKRLEEAGVHGLEIKADRGRGYTMVLSEEG